MSIATIVSLRPGGKFGSDVAWGVSATVLVILGIPVDMICCAVCITHFVRKAGRPR